MKCLKPKYEDCLCHSQRYTNQFVVQVIFFMETVVDNCKKSKRKDPMVYNGHCGVICFWYNHQIGPNRKSGKQTNWRWSDNDPVVPRSTSLDMKIKGIEIESFQSNKGSPQGYRVSENFFNIYLDDSLRHVCCEFNLKRPDTKHSYSKTEKSSLPKEIAYSGYTDFISKTKEEKSHIIGTVNAVFPSRNLKVNEDKTEHTFLQCRNWNTETWRNVKKVGFLLGDSEDIIQRKQLAMSSMNKFQVVWIRRDHIR